MTACFVILGEVFARSVAGLVTFLALPNHVDFQPVFGVDRSSDRLPDGALAIRQNGRRAVTERYPVQLEHRGGGDCSLRTRSSRTAEYDSAVRET